MKGWSPFTKIEEEEVETKESTYGSDEDLIAQGFTKNEDGMWVNEEGLTPNEVKFRKGPFSPDYRNISKEETEE